MIQPLVRKRLRGFLVGALPWQALTLSRFFPVLYQS
jgi:hypothetical protein